MIRLTRLDGSELTVNCDLLESLERTPDTVVTLTTGRKHVVKESVDEVVGLVISFRKQLGMCPVLREKLAVTDKGERDDRLEGPFGRSR